MDDRTPRDTTGSAPVGPAWRPAEERGEDRPGEPPVVSENATLGRAGLSGQVLALQQRTEYVGQGQGAQVISFRLERHDQSGNRLRPIPVELRGTKFMGSLTEGDWVQVSGRWHDGTLRARRVRDLSTGASVTARSATVLKIVFLVAALAVLAAGLVIALMVIEGNSWIFHHPHPSPLLPSLKVVSP